MSEQPHLRLIDRLRGQYHIPVNDGAGPLNGSMTFSREFQTPPIQKEAADEIERVTAALDYLIGHADSVCAKLEHPTASVTIFDQVNLRSAIDAARATRTPANSGK